METKLSRNIENYKNYRSANFQYVFLENKKMSVGPLWLNTDQFRSPYRRLCCTNAEQ